VLYCAACGGFNKSNYNAMSYLRYAEQGYIVAIAEIRVVPSVTMPTPIQDAKAGIRWLRAHADDYNIDKDCFIVTGNSAGGYFSAMLGVLGNTTQYSDDIKFDVGENLDQSSAVQAVVDFYGVSDLTIIGAGLPNYDVHDSESNTEALLINGTAFGTNSGASVFDTLEKDAIYSPFTYADSNDAKFLLLHGDENDTIVSPVSTYELYKRINAAGGSAERYTLVGAGHGTKKYFNSDKVYNIVDKFMADVVASCK
jgi:acetyl esterase/lipase